MERGVLQRALEAVIFVSADPVPLARLQAVFSPDGVEPAELEEALAVVQGSCAGRGIELQEVAGGYQFRTRSEVGPWVSRLEVPRPVRFSRAAMEALAVVAYRQPITRAEIEEVRGVDCAGVIKSLLDRGLLRILGRKEVPGRPILYGTSKKFLEVFCLANLGQLPSLRELEEVLDEASDGVEGGEGGAE